MPSTNRNRFARGEIWWVNFNSPISASTPPDGSPPDRLPTTGDEIYKIRPAVVVGITLRTGPNIHLVVPIRNWRQAFQKRNYFWMIKVESNDINGLRKTSAADTLALRSASAQRFSRKMGVIGEREFGQIMESIAVLLDL